MSLEHSPGREGRTIIRFPKVRELTGLARTTVWRRVRAGSFPAPVALGGGGMIGWYLDEVESWQAAQPRVHYAPKSDPDQPLVAA